MTRIIGCDPGLSGSLAMIDSDGLLLELIDMPTLKLTKSKRALDRADIVDTLEDWTPEEFSSVKCRVIIEQAQAMPNQGSVSGFKNGTGYGTLLGILAALRLPYETVAPKKWQSEILGKIDAGTSKAHARQWAQQNYPKADLGKRKSEDRSDAICIAEYGRRQWVGR